MAAADAVTEKDLPEQEIPATAWTPIQRRLALVLLFALMGLVATAGGYLTQFQEYFDEKVGMLWLGCMAAGIPQLLAVWAVFRRQPLAVRWPQVLGLAACLGLLLLWAFPQATSDGGAFIVASGGLLLLLTIVMVPLLHVARWWWGWRIDLTAGCPFEISYSEQFSLRRLFAWLAGTALLLGLARWVATPWSVADFSAVNCVQTLLQLGMAANLTLPLLPWLLALLGYCLAQDGRRRFAIWSHLMAVVVLASQYWTGQIIAQMFPNYGPLELTDLVSFNLGFLGTMFLGLGTLRLVGYRLVRHPRHAVLRQPVKASLPATAGDRPRRWWHSPLPYLVAILAIVGPLVAWTTWQIEQERQQAKADWDTAEPFRKLGVTAFIRYGHLVQLQFPEHEPISDVVLQLLPQYTAGQHLEELDFSGRKLTNEQLKYLGGVICLKKLNLRDTQITDAGLEHLRSLPALQILDLSETAITDEGLKIVAAYPRLTNLALQRTRVSDAGVLHLQPLRNLACLDLGNTSITDESLKTVRKFKMLYFLNLAGTQTTDTGLMDLSPLHRLDLLGIANTQVTDQGITRLKEEFGDRCDISTNTSGNLIEFMRMHFELVHPN